MVSRPSNLAAISTTGSDHARRVYEANGRLAEATNGALGSPAALDILLFLLAEDRGGGVTTSCCCTAANVPRTTGLRWISVLVAAGLVTQYEDPADRRVTLLRLTRPARDALEAWLHAIGA